MADFISIRARFTEFYGLWTGFSIAGGHIWVNGCRFRAALHASYGIERSPAACGRVRGGMIAAEQPQRCVRAISSQMNSFGDSEIA
jgi:hypothetical protein